MKNEKGEVIPTKYEKAYLYGYIPEAVNSPLELLESTFMTPRYPENPQLKRFLRGAGTRGRKN